MTLKDIALEFEDAVSPVNLDCEEEEIETEVVECPNPYSVTATCYVCEKTLRIAVVTSADGIRQLQLLLLDSLSLLCAACCSDAIRAGRPRNGP